MHKNVISKQFKVNGFSTYLLLSLKIVALIAFIYHTNQGFLERLEYLIDSENYSTLVVFIILWAFSIIVLLAVSFQRSSLVRFFWAAVISLTTAVSYGFYAAGGSELEVLDVLELWQARHETGRAFEHFRLALIQAILVAALSFITIWYPPPKVSFINRKFFRLSVWLPIIPVLLFSSLIFIKSDKAVAGLPQQFTPAAMTVAVASQLISQKIPIRKNVENAPNSLPKVKHLLYLVDESINPDYLYSKDGKLIEGLAEHQSKIADFGISVSGSNCSERSNAILRLGATRDNLIQNVRTNPSIWQYAKKAGFRTVYIDSQATGNITTKPNDFQNYMTTVEAKFIDKFYKVKDVATPELDYRLLELIKEELAGDKPTFIYANKNGAHFPYNNNYPESEAIFQPVFIDNGAQGLGGLLDLYQEDNSIEKVINTYKNAIHWTVDKFFSKFFDEIDLSNTAVIYTSDHGQYFHPSSTTHCTSGYGAPVAEGLVPLMLITEKPTLLSRFKKAAEANYNITDHFSIYPTLLELFGYSKESQNYYGLGLLEQLTANKSAFNTGDILGIISTDTMWREVNMKERIEFAPNVPKSSGN